MRFPHATQWLTLTTHELFLECSIFQVNSWKWVTETPESKSSGKEDLQDTKAFVESLPSMGRWGTQEQVV